MVLKENHKERQELGVIYSKKKTEDVKLVESKSKRYFKYLSYIPVMNILL